MGMMDVSGHRKALRWMFLQTGVGTREVAVRSTRRGRTSVLAADQLNVQGLIVTQGGKVVRHVPLYRILFRSFSYQFSVV